MFSKRKSLDWTSQRQPAAPSFRERLSGFVRLGHGLARKPTFSLLREPLHRQDHQRPSLDVDEMEISRQAAALPHIQVKDFGTSRLEIDLQSLEAFRDLVPPRVKTPETPKKQKGGSPSKKPTTTPIADMFAKRATVSPVAMPSLTKSTPTLLIGTAAEQPGSVSAGGLGRSGSLKTPTADFSVIGPSTTTTTEAGRRSRAPSRAAAHSSVTVEIVDSSLALAQPHTPRPWPPPETPRTTAATPVWSTASDPKQPVAARPREPRRAAAAGSITSEPIIITGPIARSRQNSTAATDRQPLPQRPPSADKRHSTPARLPPSLTISTAPAADPQQQSSTDGGSCSSGVPPERRRRSWQPASVAGTPRSSGPPSASAPWRSLEGSSASARRPSARLGSDRLAWLRDLEGGKKQQSGASNDLPVLKKMQGSVADKLARFERQGQQQTPLQQGLPPQPIPLSRSGSTRSRTSSVTADTFMSTSYGGSGIGGCGTTATARSSIDSHRASSVFSHYDDSFREKMERLTANANQKVEDQGKPDTTKVASTFVAVERGSMH